MQILNKNMSVGQIIKELRESKNLTQQELAKGICSRNHIYLIESSKRSPSIYLLHDLSKILGYSLIEKIFSSERLT